MVLTVLPLVPVDYWAVRIFDFPHLQLTVLTLLAVLTYLVKFDIRSIRDYLFIAVLSGCLFFQGLKIYPYTPLAPFEVGTSSSNDSSIESYPKLSIYTANVLQDNESFKSVVKDAEAFDADILLFTETNARWIDQLVRGLGRNYGHKMQVPKENTYGMLLLSKYKLREKQISYLVEDTIPSIHAQLVLPTGENIQIFAIHPAPPSPNHNPSSVDRDAELIKVARLARNTELPVVVMGDFNDVAWSETTELFQKTSGLLDLRKGRGFFNTYNANSWLMRWPLDHVFTSPEFRVGEIRLGSYIGSDHFPFYTELSLEPRLGARQRLQKPEPEVLEEAREQIKNEKQQGSDPW